MTEQVTAERIAKIHQLIDQHAYCDCYDSRQHEPGCPQPAFRDLLLALDAASAERDALLHAREVLTAAGGETVRQLRVAEAERDAAQAEWEKAKVDGWCDVCCGTGKPKSDRQCICGGTGLAADAMINLRAIAFNVEAERDAAIARAEAAEAELARLRAQIAERLTCRGGYPHYCPNCDNTITLPAPPDTEGA